LIFGSISRTFAGVPRSTSSSVPARAQKVTALITRPGPEGPELIVFDHGVAGIQLPAGTVEEGEPFDDAVMREAWEETGALGLELVRELAVVRRETPSRTEVRRVYHLRSTVEMPDEWVVATPDGGGTVWTCFWVPVEDAHSMVHEYQRDWLDAVRPALDKSAIEDPVPRARPPLPAALVDENSWEEFWAYSFANRRFVMSFVDDIDPDVCTRARALCVTDAGAVVLVAGDQSTWDIPGGGREPGESIADNLAREVEEESCSRVVDSVFVTALRGAPLGPDGGVAGEPEHHALFWARVELEPWDPKFETRFRRLVGPEEAVELSTFPDTTRRLLDAAVAFDPMLTWELR
jgi:8-oxo-dGTP pyrophosphatase MutT (NUDIX family)